MPSVCLPTLRYEERRVTEVRESISVAAIPFPLFVALLTDYESCEGAIHRVVGHLAWREDMRRSQESAKGCKPFFLRFCPLSHVLPPVVWMLVWASLPCLT